VVQAVFEFQLHAHQACRKNSENFRIVGVGWIGNWPRLHPAQRGRRVQDRVGYGIAVGWGSWVFQHMTLCDRARHTTWPASLALEYMPQRLCLCLSCLLLLPLLCLLLPPLPLPPLLPLLAFCKTQLQKPNCNTPPFAKFNPRTPL
jgi:hypothetical protein